MLDLSKFLCRFPQRPSLQAGVFPNPKSKNYSRTSSFVISLRTHEEKLLSFHFKCRGFGFGLNSSLCKTSQFHSFTLGGRWWCHRKDGFGLSKHRAVTAANWLQGSSAAQMKANTVFFSFKAIRRWKLFWYVELNNNIYTSCFSLNMLRI